jgi:hypothetical protein
MVYDPRGIRGDLFFVEVLMLIIFVPVQLLGASQTEKRRVNPLIDYSYPSLCDVIVQTTAVLLCDTPSTKGPMVTLQCKKVLWEAKQTFRENDLLKAFVHSDDRSLNEIGDAFPEYSGEYLVFLGLHNVVLEMVKVEDGSIQPISFEEYFAEKGPVSVMRVTDSVQTMKKMQKELPGDVKKNMDEILRAMHSTETPVRLFLCWCLLQDRRVALERILDELFKAEGQDWILLNSFVDVLAWDDTFGSMVSSYHFWQRPEETEKLQEWRPKIEKRRRTLQDQIRKGDWPDQNVMKSMISMLDDGRDLSAVMTFNDCFRVSSPPNVWFDRADKLEPRERMHFREWLIMHQDVPLEKLYIGLRIYNAKDIVCGMNELASRLQPTDDKQKENIMRRDWDVLIDCNSIGADLDLEKALSVEGRFGQIRWLAMDLSESRKDITWNNETYSPWFIKGNVGKSKPVPALPQEEKPNTEVAKPE